MKFISYSFTILLLFCTGFLFAQEFPAKPQKLVNDYTQTLSQSEIDQLENKLVAFDDSTSTQIAVVIIKSLEGYDVSDYGSRLAESWGIGGAENNNGVLVLIALGDRKVTIQTGYGVEGALPDAIAKRIIENEVTPQFKTGNYFAGIDQGTDALISYTKGEYINENPKNAKSEGGGPSILVIIVIIFLIFIIGRKGGGKGGSQVIGGRGGASPFWWLLLGNQLGRGSGGGFGGFSGGGGGFGGGGGGFGGFGGGSFGGGGASGSW